MPDKQENRILIDVSLPNGWSELSQKQLRFVFDIIARGESKESLITLCFLRWSGVRVLAHDRKSGRYLLSFGKQIFGVSSVEMTQWMRPLGWLAEMPDYPVCIRKVGRHKSVEPSFSEVPYDKYVDSVFLWNNFVSSESDQVIKMLVKVLYGFKPKRLKPWLKINVIYWISSLNNYLAAEYPHLFGKAAKNADGTGSLGGGSTVPVLESVNAMIRALTKGDVLKEKDVLKVDTHRALNELEALGREFDDLKAKMKSHERL